MVLIDRNGEKMQAEPVSFIAIDRVFYPKNHQVPYFPFCKKSENFSPPTAVGALVFMCQIEKSRKAGVADWLVCH